MNVKTNMRKNRNSYCDYTRENKFNQHGKLTKVISVSVLMLCCIFFISSITNAAIYYVDATLGNNGNNGLSSSSAWKTIGKVNNFNFSDGDTVRFKRGETFNDATLGSPAVDDFTFEDYGTGVKPILDGDSNQPISIKDNTVRNLTIRNIDISGQDWKLGKSANLNIYYVDGLTIDGVTGDGHAGGNDSGQVGKTAIDIRSTTGTITVMNCTLYNWGPDPILSGSSDLIGIVLHTITSGTISVHDNTIHDITADGIQPFQSTATTKIYNNLFYNFGEQAIDVKISNNVEIYDNEFYTEPGFVPGSGGSGGRNTFIATGADDIADDNIIRNNYFHDSNSTAIWFKRGSRSKAYRNRIENTAGAIFVTNDAYDTEIYNNTIVNSNSHTVGDKDAGSILLWNGRGSGTKVYNNTIYNESGTTIYGINVVHTNGAEIKKNIVYLDNNASDAWAFYYKGNGADPVVDNNLWYNPSNTNRVKWVSTTYSDSQLGDWITAGHTGAKCSDPLFVDATNKDFHLQSTSPAIDMGAFAGGTTSSDVENPTTPTNLLATAFSSSQINLTWNASTDNIGVTGYKIYRDGAQITTSVTNIYSDTGLSPSTTYTYTVSAYDAIGNESGQSSPVSATTSTAPPTTASLASSNTMVANSGNFAVDREVYRLWDGITNNGTVGSSGAGNIASFWMEFDFGQNYDLTSAQLFGDADGNWASNTWTLQYKQNINATWSTAFSNINAFINGWSSQNLTITARYVRVEVFGNPTIPATQARELEIYGTPGSGDTQPPSPPFGLTIQ